MAYNFQTNIALCGYQVYKNVIGDNAKAGDNVTVKLETGNESIKIGPSCCVIKAMLGKPAQLKTVGHIPRKISRHAYFFKGREW